MSLEHFVPRRVLLTRLSAIGDCILTLPLATSVKSLWPDCELTWAVDCAAAKLLEPHASIDRVLKIPKGWLKRTSQWQQLRSVLGECEFDLVLDPQGLSKSSLLGWLSGAKVRVGFDYSHGREIAPLLATKRVRRSHSHMVDCYRELLRPWTNIEPGVGRFGMPNYEAAAESANTILQQLGMNAESWMGINPGAGWTTRIWPPERFGHVAREIYRNHGIRSLIFWAGESEKLLANVIEETSQGSARTLPRTSLTELVELIRSSDLLLTGDTGPMHMASAVGTPCVSLHGPTWSDESGPYSNQHVAVQSPLTASIPPKKLVRKGPNTAMQAIETEEVVAACQKLLRQTVLSEAVAPKHTNRPRLAA